MAELHLPSSWLTRPIKVLLVGCGGTGSEMLDELLRIHSLLVNLGGEGLSVSAFDSETVAPANIGRQRFWPCDIGFAKAEILISRVNSFAGTRWRFFNESFDVDQHASHHFDLLVTCVDTPDVRAKIGAHYALKSEDHSAIYNDKSLFWLDCGNDNHCGNVIFGHIENPNNVTKIPNVYDLYPMLATMDNSNEPSCSTAEALEKQDYGINRSVAREGANLIWQFLRHGKINYHGSYIDIRHGTVTPLPINPDVWASFAH